MPRYYEDLTPGESHECGTASVEREEMIEFAKRFDPQPIHVDPEAAQESFYGRVIASGWYTAGLVARQLVTGFMNDLASLGGRGMDELRWHRPVTAGDVLSVTVEVLDKEIRNGNPKVGDYRAAITAMDQGDDLALSMEALGVIERQPPAEGS